MRLIARFPNKEQVGSLVYALKQAGFDRGDMIISELEEEQKWDSFEEAVREETLVETGRDSIRPGEVEPFGEGIKGLKGKKGIIVAVEAPKHESDRVRAIMEQSGAVEIIQD
ncbi:MAG TPA: hypothetical protein GXX19_03980 [Syntrophomonadaceae bacterium]|nr:hypothetical protein [Syntrophomonadaceae bacterium]